MNINPGNQSVQALEADFNYREEAKLKEALHRYAGVNAECIHVKVVNNTVYITGQVASFKEMNDAEVTVWLCMPDAEDVINELKVESYLADEEFPII